MIHGEQFRRSVNIWKLTDYEKTDIYVEMYIYLNEIFKDLNIYTSNKYPLSTYYGNSKDSIILIQDLKNDLNIIHYEKVYSVFESKYSSYVSEYKDIMSIFQEYLVNTLELKGSRILLLTGIDFLILVNTLELKGSRIITIPKRLFVRLGNTLELKGSRTRSRYKVRLARLGNTLEL